MPSRGRLDDRHLHHPWIVVVEAVVVQVAGVVEVIVHGERDCEEVVAIFRRRRDVSDGVRVPLFSLFLPFFPMYVGSSILTRARHFSPPWELI